MSTKGTEQGSHNRLRPPMSEGGRILFQLSPLWCLLYLFINIIHPWLVDKTSTTENNSPIIKGELPLNTNAVYTIHISDSNNNNTINTNSYDKWKKKCFVRKCPSVCYEMTGVLVEVSYNKQNITWMKKTTYANYTSYYQLNVTLCVKEYIASDTRYCFIW